MGFFCSFAFVQSSIDEAYNNNTNENILSYCEIKINFSVNTNNSKITTGTWKYLVSRPPYFKLIDLRLC